MVLTFSEATAQAVQGAACSLLAINDEATKWINSAWGVDADFANVFGALRKLSCNDSNPDTSGVGPDTQFTGGQCDGVSYEIQFTWDKETTAGTNSDNAGFLNVFGPLQPAVQEQNENQIQLIFRDKNFEYLLDSQSEATFVAFRNISATVTRNDGQPDNCGDPAPNPIEEFNDYSETVSITYEDNSETTITEDIDITLGPLIVGIGGIVYAPVTVGTGDITIDGTLVLAPELKVDLFPDDGFGGGGDTDDPAPDPDVTDPTPTIPEGRRRIIGAIVTVTSYDESIAQVTQVAQGPTPDIFIPRTGNISFYIDTAGGQAWTEPVPLKNVRQYVPCPAREGAVDVDVTAGTGFTLDVTPVYADLAII